MAPPSERLFLLVAVLVAVGKSNFIRALQLILDPSLSERDRQLTVDQFWDGLGAHKLGAIVEVAIELTDFDDKPRLMAHLAECIVSEGPPLVARLTYRYQPKANLGRAPINVADYEYVLFGGNDPNSSLPGDLRRMLPIEVQGALRDAEKDLATWRHSPLRPLIEPMMRGLLEKGLRGAKEILIEHDRHGEVLMAVERAEDPLPAVTRRPFQTGDWARDGLQKRHWPLGSSLLSSDALRTSCTHCRES